VSPPTSLQELAGRVDELLLDPIRMAAARQMAEACLADDEQGHVDALQLPADPCNDLDWTENSILREQGVEETPILTPCQRALTLAALHAVHCRGFDPIVAFPVNFPPVDSDGRATNQFRRFTRWREIVARVRQLGDYAAHWFRLQLRRFEQDLSSIGTQQATPPEVAMPPVPAVLPSAGANPPGEGHPTHAAGEPGGDIQAAPDRCAIGLAFLFETHCANQRPTVTGLAERIGVGRQALYEDKEFAPVRELGKKLFGFFEANAKLGDCHVPRGSKDKHGNLEAEDIDEKPVDD
jgi:hypothetical protein